MNYQAVIFDLDGVLCSTDQFHYQAWSAVSDDLGIFFDESLNHKLRGVSRMESLEILLQFGKVSCSQEEKVRLADKKNEIYQKMLQTMSPDDLTEEVRDTLETLRKKGVQLAVGSSSRNAGIILKRMGIPDYFDVVVDGTQIKNSKPDPEVFLLAAQKLEREPKECLVVEDARAGVQAARSGGFDVAGLGDASQMDGLVKSLDSIRQIVDLV